MMKAFSSLIKGHWIKLQDAGLDKNFESKTFFKLVLSQTHDLKPQVLKSKLILMSNAC